MKQQLKYKQDLKEIKFVKNKLKKKPQQLKYKHNLEEIRLEKTFNTI